eukprot:CAMPEP_0116891726 /NCGR_PEP_ID=MMETSP0467-20121206/2068_1 /TAXON_ID=283647 /ORGANISM="Mesodinium pulex, Strain SPMC105" /LENGTH=30 /DNA_ID= /DNA_START= /DNA_END= /DNA_ORIENTATION=
MTTDNEGQENQTQEDSSQRDLKVNHKFNEN